MVSNVKKSERNKAFESWLRQRNAEVSQSLVVERKAGTYNCYKLRKTTSLEKWLKIMDNKNSPLEAIPVLKVGVLCLSPL